MSKFKKLTLTCIAVLSAFIFVACSNGVDATSDDKPAGNPEISLSYNKDVYKYKVEDVLKAGQSFVNQSVKSKVGARAASVQLAEEDKWQGYIDGMYNVPSNIYGTSLTASENQLKIQGEDLGTLQNLVHSKNADGNYTKAVFEYKDHLYYVWDKGVLNSNNSYVVISSADDTDTDHIVFDQQEHLYKPEWSNFKIWVWDTDEGGNVYRRGNLGYVYTIRNVELAEGTYATITVGGFGYYQYGFRVWIKDCDGPFAEPAGQGEAGAEDAYKPEELKTVTEGEDFIYEVVNNTSDELTVANYIRDYSKAKFDEGIVAQTEDVVIAKGGKYQFKYKTADLKKYDNGSTSLGCFFTPKGKWRCGGWENGLDIENKVHTVTVTDSEDYCIEGVNSYRFLDVKELIEAEDDYDFIYEVVNNTSGKVTIANYIRSWNNSTKKDKYLAQTKDIVLEKGKTYQFKYSTAELQEAFKAEDNNTSIHLGCFFTPEDKWTCGGWENSLTNKNKIHRVTLTDDKNSCVNGENKWIDNDPNAIIFTPLATDKGIEITLKNIQEKTSSIQVRDNKNCQTIYQINNSNNASLPEEITFLDEYVETGKEYNYYVTYQTTDGNKKLEPVTVKATGGKGSLSLTVKPEEKGVVITPDKAILDMKLSYLRIRRDYADDNIYGCQSIYRQIQGSQDYSVTDYFVTKGMKYIYKLENAVMQDSYIDEQNKVQARYFPRLEAVTVTIPENCGTGELELSTPPIASWDNENQKVVITQLPVVSNNYPENATLNYVGFIYHAKEESRNCYLEMYLTNPATEPVSLSWDKGKTYYPTDKAEWGDRGYVIMVSVENTNYQIYKTQDKVFDGLPQEITLK